MANRFGTALVILGVSVLFGGLIGLVAYVNSHMLREGEVYEKNFYPAHTESNYTYNFSTDQFEYQTEEIPDRWSISFRKIDEKTNKWRTSTLNVSEKTYMSLTVGDYYREQP